MGTLNVFLRPFHSCIVFIIILSHTILTQTFSLKDQIIFGKFNCGVFEVLRLRCTWLCLGFKIHTSLFVMIILMNNECKNKLLLVRELIFCNNPTANRKILLGFSKGDADFWVCLHKYVTTAGIKRWAVLCSDYVHLTSGVLGVRSSSVELWPMPEGIPAVRYMDPTSRLFLASFASFTRSTVRPCSAKLFMPSLACAPSCHSRYCSLWVMAAQKLKQPMSEG